MPPGSSHVIFMKTSRTLMKFFVYFWYFSVFVFFPGSWWGEFRFITNFFKPEYQKKSLRMKQVKVSSCLGPSRTNRIRFFNFQIHVLFFQAEMIHHMFSVTKLGIIGFILKWSTSDTCTSLQFQGIFCTFYSWSYFLALKLNIFTCVTAVFTAVSMWILHPSLMFHHLEAEINMWDVNMLSGRLY